jgi:hypothetical protein
VVSGTNKSRKENTKGLKTLSQKEIYELKLVLNYYLTCPCRNS